MHFNHVLNHFVKRIIVPLMFLIGTEVVNAFDMQAIFNKHAENCKYDQNENQKTFLANLFSSEISDQCIRYARDRTREDLDTLFFRENVSDSYFPDISNFSKHDIFEDKKNNPGTPADRSVETYSVKDKKTDKNNESLPTVRGYKSMGAL